MRRSEDEELMMRSEDEELRMRSAEGMRKSKKKVGRGMLWKKLKRKERCGVERNERRRD